MRAVTIDRFGEAPRVREIDVPEPRGTEIRLRVRAAGVCHTDLTIIKGETDLGDGRSMSGRDRYRYPLTLGHETAGTADALGPDAAGVTLGADYLVYPWIGCGTCAACTAGNENWCPSARSLGMFANGGYAEYLLVPNADCLVPLDGLDPVTTAPFACSGLTAYAALRRLSHTAGPLVIIGAGGLGLTALRLLPALGKTAVVIERDAEKRALALTYGALAAIDPDAADATAAVVTAAGGPVAAVIDCVGAPATAGLALAVCGKGATIVLAGVAGGAAPWPLPLITIKALSIIGIYAGTAAELRALLELVRTNHIEPLPIRSYRLADALSALADLADGRIVGRAVLTP